MLGGGPAGATLAALLADAGLEVAIFSRAKRPPIIVGESLVPAVVPMLRRLGIEEEVAGYGVHKAGATFCFNGKERLDIRFDEVRGAVPRYAYNVPRDRFDASVLRAAQRKGAVLVEESAQLERLGDDRVGLSAASQAAAGDALSGPPDFVVDAGGRTRTLARLLALETEQGGRRDAALHAHHRGVEVEIPGNVHTDRLDHGWAWRIPLQGRVSVGVVVDSEYLKKLGDSPEEQYDNCLRLDSVLRDWIRPAQRVTPVMKYDNYQLRTRRGVGENWALVGDAFGFVDPVFSSGALIAFQSADSLAQALLSGTPAALAAYEAYVLRNLDAWQRVIEQFYNGRLLTLLKLGDRMRRTPPGKLMNWHFSKHMPRIFTGEDVTNPYSLGLVEFMTRYAIWGEDPSLLEIA